MALSQLRDSQVCPPEDGQPETRAHRGDGDGNGDGAPTHVHLWHLADGTGLHAPYGELTMEEGTGRLCCHLCGRWFQSLGSHVRAHGYTAESYRADLGICRRQPLTASNLSEAISVRQRAAYEGSTTVRERFAVGQDMARRGVLGRGAAQARAHDPLPASAVARQVRALARGRETTASRRDTALEHLVEDSGSIDLPSYLRDRYEDGASLDQLATETGLGRARLRAEVRAAGIVVRKSGQNTRAGHRSRALAAEAAAARTVGTDDLRQWLHTRRDQGWTLAALADVVGHSSHWVKWRLTPPVRTGHVTEPRPTDIP